MNISNYQQEYKKQSDIADLNLLNILLNASHDYIYFKDKDSKFIKLNQKAVWALGVKSPQDAIGKSDADFFPEIADQTRIDEIAIMESGKPQINEVIAVTFADGKQHWVSVSKVPFYDQQGNVQGIAGISREITSEVKKEQEIHEQNRFLYNILNTSPNCIYVKDKEGRYIIANKAIAKLYQTTPDEMIGKKDTDFSDQAMLKPNEADYFINIDSKVIETKEPQTIPCESFTWNDGTIRYFHTTKIPITYKDNPDCVMGISVDITDVKSSEKEMMENEEKFRSIFDSSILGIIIFQDGKIVLTNHAINELMGYTQEYYDSLSPIETLDLIHPDDRKIVAQRFQERIKGKDIPDSYNIRVFTKSNTQRILNINPQIIDYQGKPAIEVIAKDVTDQIKSEQELQTTKQRLEDAERTARIGNVEWFVKEAKGYWSDVMFDLYERDRSLGVPSYDEIMALHHPDDAKRLEKAVNKAITEGIPYAVDLRTNLPSGKEMVFHAIGVPIRDEQGVVSSIKGTVQDVTKRVEIEHRLQLSEENYKSIFNNTLDSIFVHDYKTGKIIDVNQATIDTFGYSKEEISEMDVGDLSINEPPYTQKDAVEWIQKAASDGPQRFEWLAKNKTDELIWFDDYLQLVEIAGEKRILVIGRNINEKKKTEQALKYAHDRYLRLAENVPGVIYQYKQYPDERKDEFTYISPSVREMYGLDPFKVQENSDLMWDAILPDDVDSFSQSISDAEKKMSMWHTQWRIRTTKGMLKWLEGIARLERLPDGSLLWDGLITDISERKQMEEEIKENEEKFKLLFENSISGVVICRLVKDDEGNPVDYIHLQGNPACEKHLGKKPGHLINKKATELIGTEAGLKYAQMNGSTVLTGKPNVWIDHTPIPYDRYLKMYSYLIKDEIFAIVFEDITEIMKADQELKNNNKLLIELNDNLEEIILQRTMEVEKLLTQKDEFINQLGHDLKNPLGPLINLLPVLEKKETDPKKKEMIKVMYRNAGYMKNLVTKTIELAKLNSPNTVFHFKDVNLSNVVKNVIDINQMFYQEQKIKIINIVPEDINLDADPIHLQELFSNLLNNSAKFTKDMGEVFISAEKDADTVTVSIKDNGIGMTQDQIDHIFDEFYKVDGSRHDFDSSGLGMPICKRIVEIHGGEIWVESEGLNRGTTISFTLKIKTDYLTNHGSGVRDEEVENEKIKWISHEGKEILYFDFADFTDDDYELVLKEITNTIVDGGKRDLLVLTNAMDNLFSIESLRKTRKIGKTIQPFMKKNAIVGLTRHQDMFLNAIKVISGIEIHSFPTLDEAKDWLVKDKTDKKQ